MYKIIGADGQEYGPVTDDQMRQWIAEGRANAESKVQAEGTEDWKTLREIPEFAEPLATAASAQAAAPPTVAAVEAEALAAEIINRGVQIEIGACISRSWELVKSRFWPIVGVTFLVMLAYSAASAIPMVGGIVGMVLGGVFFGGLYWYFFKLIRGHDAGVGDAFAGFTLAFVQLMLAGIVSSLLQLIGFLLCILPGIYLAVAWVFTFPLVIDKRLEFWQAMELSRKVVTKCWWSMFGLLIVTGIIAMAGILVFCVGIFVTMPIAFGALAYAYQDIFGRHSEPAA